MKLLYILLCLMLSLPAWADSTIEAADPSNSKTGKSRLTAPGTLSGYRSDKPVEKPQAMPPVPQLAPPPVLRYHEDRRPPPGNRFPQFGHRPGQGNPWEYGTPSAEPRAKPAPPPVTAATPGNPWRLDQRLLSSPGMPGLDPALPLAPADPLLSPMPYQPYGATPYGMYPPAGGSSFMPFGQGFPPAYRNGRDNFPFSMPMDWF